MPRSYRRITLPFLIGILCFFVSVITAGATTCDPQILQRAQNGDYNAQSYVAHHYASVASSDLDYQKARYWYNKVATHQEADAKIVAHANLLLGIMYNQGKGGSKDYRKALECYRIAARQEYTIAYISIGNLYAQGLGVPKDYRQALLWWKRAADKGHPKAPALIRSLTNEIAGTTALN